MKLFIQTPSSQDTWYALSLPFSRFLWLCVAALAIILTILYTICLRTYEITKKENTNEFYFYQNFTNIIGALLCQQGTRQIFEKYTHNFYFKLGIYNKSISGFVF